MKHLFILHYNQSCFFNNELKSFQIYIPGKFDTDNTRTINIEENDRELYEDKSIMTCNIVNIAVNVVFTASMNK